MSPPVLPKHIRLTQADAWALQAVVRHDAKIAKQEHGYEFRRKVNDAILRFAHAVPTPLYVDILVTEEECWLIDVSLPQGAYQGARDLLLQAFAVLCEYEYGIGPQIVEAIASALETEGKDDDGSGEDTPADDSCSA